MPVRQPKTGLLSCLGHNVAHALQDEIKDQLGNEETQAGILLDLGRASQAEEVYR